jgi:hypothetical protein
MRANLSHAIAIYVSVAVALLSGCTAKRGQAGPVEPMVSDSAEAGETAALEAALTAQTKEVADLNGEIDRLRQREDELTQRLKQALRSRPGKTISDRPKAGEAAPAPEATIKQLQDELRNERQRRVQLEQQLNQMRVETSKPPLPVTAGVEPAKPIPPALLPPAAQPIAETSLPEEEIAPPPAPVVHAAPQIETAPPQVEAPPPAHEVTRAMPLPSGDEAAEIASLRTRGVEQESKHQEAMASLSQVLDADRRRQEDLEAQIVALRTGAPGTEGAVSGDSNEVHHLRSRLEEERRKNAELMAKLKLAGRVTDLVFRMQNQGAPAPASQPPLPPRSHFPQVSQTGPDGPGPNSPHQPYTNDEGEVNQPIVPRSRDVEAPDEIDGPEQNEVPQAEVPPVFDDGPNVVEETTQD